MLRRFPLWVLTTLLVLSLDASEAIPGPGTLVELQPVEFTSMQVWDRAFQERMAADLGSTSEAFKGLSPEKAFKHLVRVALHQLVPSMGLTYSSEDSHGHPRLYSGRLFLPSHHAGSAPTRLPLVIYQHGTETKRDKTPYHKDGPETMLGALGAQAGGFAVAMPDGDGMGADPSPEPHAYIHAATSARCLIDLIRAIKGSSARIFDGINYVWDGRLFIMGYSEGGYIALAAVKELSTNPAFQDIKLDGAACMGGPFDLHQTIKNMVEDTTTPYTRPYIPAYLLGTWPTLYPEDFDASQALNPKLLEGSPALPGNPDHGSVLQWVDGGLEGDAITSRIQARLTGDKDQAVLARAVMNEAWVKTHLDPENSRVNQLLESNSLVEGWAPRVPVLLAHDPKDECVPYSNTRNLYDAWNRRGIHPLEIVDLAAGGRGAGHVGGALISIPAAFIWFRSGMPSSLMSLAVNTLEHQALAAVPYGLGPVLKKTAEWATQEQSRDRAEFPLSEVRYRPNGQAGPWTVTLADTFYSLGKVKIYTLAPFPQFQGQHALPGVGEYTRFVRQLKQRGDSYAIGPDEPCYFAVYPEKGSVALTLGFQASHGAGRLNIKQMKNKLMGSTRPAFDGDGAFLLDHVHTPAFENPLSSIPFVSLTAPERR